MACRRFQSPRHPVDSERFLIIFVYLILKFHSQRQAVHNHQTSCQIDQEARNHDTIWAKELFQDSRLSIQT